MDKRTTVIDKAKEYKKLADNILPVKVDQFWLYGSFAKGTYNEFSDIDIAMVVSHIDDDVYWNNLPLLWKLSYQVDDRIEPIVVARDTDYAGFIEEIQRTGILIN